MVWMNTPTAQNDPQNSPEEERLIAALPLKRTGLPEEVGFFWMSAQALLPLKLCLSMVVEVLAG